MKRYCKNIDVTDVKFIKRAIDKYRMNKKNRPTIIHELKCKFGTPEHLAEIVSE